MRTNLVGRHVRTRLVGVPRDANVEAVGSEAARGRAADSRIRARDDRDRHTMSFTAIDAA
jgi:hypothetical protein